MANYTREALRAVTAELPGRDDDLIRLYALLALVKGKETTLSDIHDAWSLWRLNTHPDHPSIVPFAQLPPAVAELDRPYMEAVHRAAIRLSIKEGVDVS